MKTIKLFSDQLGLINYAFLQGLFPKPYENDLLLGELLEEDINDYEYDEYRNYYLSEEYYEKLNFHIKSLKNSGKFQNSNSSDEWLELADIVNNAQNINYPNEKVIIHPLSIKKDNESIEKKFRVLEHKRSNGMLIANDELWNKMLSVTNGRITIEQNKITVQMDNKLPSLEFDKNIDVQIAKAMNSHYALEESIFNIYETQSSEGVFLFYQYKNKPNEFSITTLGGIVKGSSINCEIL